MADRRIQRIKRLILYMALIVLAGLILHVSGGLFSIARPPVLPSSTPTGQAVPLPRQIQAETTPGSDNLSLLTMTPLFLESPADAWANLLLDNILPLMEHTPMLPDGLIWWQGGGSGGELAVVADLLSLGGHPLAVDKESMIDILLPDQSDPNRLNLAGVIEQNEGALTLTIVRQGSHHIERRWLLSNAMPSLALKALVVQAELRGIWLEGAYTQNPGMQAQLVLIGNRSLSTSAVASPIHSDLTTPTASLTPIASPTPTPTRAPDPYMGRILAAKIDPVIDAMFQLPPEIMLAFITHHPWTGTLIWTETGAQINRQPTAILQATELNFYMLESGGGSGSTSRFLTIFYTEGVTRFPDDLVYFQGQRMGEALYWIVRRAAERDGQLYVAYDDLGTRQAITIIGFEPFITPGS